MRVLRIRYTDRRGRTRQSSKWYTEIPDPKGIRHRIPGFRDRAATEELGRKLERLSELRAAREQPDLALAKWVSELPRPMLARLARLGIVATSRVAAARPLVELLEEFVQSLKAGEGPEVRPEPRNTHPGSSQELRVRHLERSRAVEAGTPPRRATGSRALGPHVESRALSLQGVRPLGRRAGARDRRSSRRREAGQLPG